MKESQQPIQHLFATIGAKTALGGRVTTATSGLVLMGLAVANVGDVVTYDDGSEAVIIDGAGGYAYSGDKPFALVGSHLSNGDRIVETLQTGRGIVVREGDTVEGLFDLAYVPRPAPPRYRLAMRGATTARGGVLREVSSGWTLPDMFGNAGAVGDLIHYRDGSTARIVSGLGLVDNGDFKPLAFVGSKLDNGDTITDSPERVGAVSSSMFTVMRR
ncbi:PAAR domain-containing protein [Cupriavidus numazuensis]|uniref:Uncharacterized protein n=1 Tax=Cupriavidus numazuensis TaxID=221992 RepID=A0ABM8TAN4_9BURK|nr:PAAR domain-containing protein [Cupriavidus numazuensis]CAG2130743.1 hypothetical protein LMG26411_00405 [Cupriavidus numazuensis]